MGPAESATFGGTRFPSRAARCAATACGRRAGWGVARSDPHGHGTRGRRRGRPTRPPSRPWALAAAGSSGADFPGDARCNPRALTLAYPDEPARPPAARPSAHTHPAHAPPLRRARLRGARQARRPDRQPPQRQQGAQARVSPRPGGRGGRDARPHLRRNPVQSLPRDRARRRSARHAPGAPASHPHRAPFGAPRSADRQRAARPTRRGDDPPVRPRRLSRARRPTALARSRRPPGGRPPFHRPRGRLQRPGRPRLRPRRGGDRRPMPSRSALDGRGRHRLRRHSRRARAGLSSPRSPSPHRRNRGLRRPPHLPRHRRPHRRGCPAPLRPRRPPAPKASTSSTATRAAATRSPPRRSSRCSATPSRLDGLVLDPVYTLKAFRAVVRPRARPAPSARASSSSTRAASSASSPPHGELAPLL
jgi:hypothetical protein